MLLLYELCYAKTFLHPDNHIADPEAEKKKNFW